MIVVPRIFDVLERNIAGFKNIKFSSGNYQPMRPDTETLYCFCGSPINFLPAKTFKFLD